MGKVGSLAGRESFERRAKMYGIQSSEGYKWHLSAILSELQMLLKSSAVAYLRKYRLKSLQSFNKKKLGHS
jgi:cystathionine beta-lyase family protein involved in aluminum resistance